MSSSYEVRPHKPLEHVCRVGYDPGVDSYFMYVSRPLVTDERTRKQVGDFDGHVIEWKGTTAAEIDSVEQLARLLEPYATLPADLYQTLRDDRLRRGPTSEKALTARG